MAGIEETSILDLVTCDEANRVVALIMIATQPWTEERVLALQSKTQRYLDFVESGELSRAYPEAQGMRVRLQLDASFALTELAKQFVVTAEREWCRPLGIQFVVEEN